MLGTLQQRHKRNEDCEQALPSPKKTTTTPANKGANALALLALVFFASAAPVATQLARRPDGSYPFEVVDVVLRAEILKLCIAASCLAYELRGLGETERRERAPTPTTKGLLLTLAVGAGYQALNILGGFAMRILDDPTLFAVIVQSKVVWTGVLGVYAFGRRLSSARVFSLVLVAAGAAVCAAPKPNTDASKVRTRITGCLLAGGAALLSAVLTVACEAVVKRGRASLHWQNLQLYVVGIVVTASTLTKRPSLMMSYAMGALIILEACKGLAISLVLKRTDAVVKTLATTLSIPGVAVMERLVVPGVAPMALPMLLGGCAVVLAITAYHEGPDGRDKPFLAAALGLTLFGAASLAVDAGWPRRELLGSESPPD
jgi:hypothetical protein